MKRYTILFVGGPNVSNFGSKIGLAEELASRGHEVFYSVTPRLVPGSNSNSTHYWGSKVQLLHCGNDLLTKAETDALVARMAQDDLSALAEMIGALVGTYRLHVDAIRKQWKSSARALPDLIITDTIDNGGQVLAELWNVPVMYVNPHGLSNGVGQCYYDPPWIPQLEVPLGPDMNVLEKVANFLVLAVGYRAVLQGTFINSPLNAYRASLGLPAVSAFAYDEMPNAAGMFYFELAGCMHTEFLMLLM